jgi:hypothetical protein
VSAIFVGRLAALHLRHVSTVFGGSAGREWVLHSKLDLPAFLATHSAAIVRSFSPILLFGLPFYGGSNSPPGRIARCLLWVISGHRVTSAQRIVPSTMNDLDFVALVRSAVVFFILSLKVFAFVMLSKPMKAKNFGALPSRAITFSVRAK